MIASLLLALPAIPPVVRYLDPESPNVTIQVLVRLPKLNEAERFCALAAWDSILEGSEEYSRVTLRAYGQQAGRAIAATTVGDHLLLRVTFPKAQLSTGVSMAESILRRPLLIPEALEAAIARRQISEGDPWLAALNPEGWSEGKPTRDEIVSTFRRLVRPDNMVLAFGGAFDENAVTAELRRFEDWQPRPERLVVRAWAAQAKPRLRGPAEVETFELYGPEVPAGTASFATDLLAAATLGTGKGSALHRVAREAKGWSYRQEGFLQPSPGGIRLRMILARRPVEDPAAFLGEWREAMLADVKGWTQADRSRALGQLKSWLEIGMGISPLRLLPEGRIMASLEERTHLHAWWRMKFGSELNEADLLGLMNQVRLEDLKSAAAAMVEGASGRFLIGGS